MPNRRDDADIMYRLLVQGVTDYAIFMLSPDGTVANWNAGAQRTKGYTAEEIVGRNFARFYAPEDRAAGLPEQGLRTARRDGRFESEGWRLRRDGSRFWAQVVIDAIHDDDGCFIGFAKVTRDCTERRRSENRIQHLAGHDPLTDLANRATLRQALTEALASGTGESCAVLYIDLDRFKPINDTLGHSVGDQLLQEVARRLRRMAGAQDVVGRLGGDEFALILRPADPHRVAGVARQILEALNQPYTVKKMPIRVGASIGIAVAPLAGGDADILLRNADLALYDAKKEGRSRYSFYEPAMGDSVAARTSLENALGRAVARREFVLHYQPIVRARSGATIGFEALLRWRRPDAVAPSPAEFVPVAEEAGLMPEIGAWILAEACREAATWPAHLTVAVNVSATQLRSALFIDAVERALAASGLPPHRLELEITETAVLQNREVALGLLQRLRALGVMIALDDFGTGYSSLSFVHTFPLTRLKIDRSFVHGLGRDPQATAIVRAIIGLSRSLRLAVTAEGVETEEQRRLLAKERGLDLQGYLFGRPEAAARLDRTVELRRPARRAALSRDDRPSVQGQPEAA
ncbi:EAL domain-containing protein [Methylorubrum podarium]|uniref:EAL domain-containing protein n=1 Tax=Methylorubrum podarium TaxID=200476 RepID=A0ABV1QQQ8_9HYPH